jgi:hypothetical protein
MTPKNSEVDRPDNLNAGAGWSYPDRAWLRGCQETRCPSVPAIRGIFGKQAR